MSDLSFTICRDTLSSAVRQFMVTQAHRISEGQVSAVADNYALPLVVSLPEVEQGFVVVTSRDRIERFFRLHHEGMQDAGLPSLRVRIGQVDETAQGRITALVDWFFLGRDGSRAGQMTARYFLQRHRGGFCVQMVEFDPHTFSPIMDWFQDAMSAADPTRHVRLN